MKVVALICDLSRGGAQGVFVNVVNYIYEKGIDIEIVVQSLMEPVYKERLNSMIPITSLELA